MTSSYYLAPIKQQLLQQLARAVTNGTALYNGDLITNIEIEQRAHLSVDYLDENGETYNAEWWLGSNGSSVSYDATTNSYTVKGGGYADVFTISEASGLDRDS